MAGTRKRSLRGQLIRLAHENPNIQEAILPLLKQAQYPSIYRSKPEAWGLDSDYEGTHDAARDLTAALVKGNNEIDKLGKALARAVHKSLENLKRVGYKHRDAGANSPDTLSAGRDAVEEYTQATINEILKVF